MKKKVLLPPYIIYGNKFSNKRSGMYFVAKLDVWEVNDTPSASIKELYFWIVMVLLTRTTIIHRQAHNLCPNFWFYAKIFHYFQSFLKLFSRRKVRFIIIFLLTLGMLLFIRGRSSNLNWGYFEPCFQIALSCYRKGLKIHPILDYLLHLSVTMDRLEEWR